MSHSTSDWKEPYRVALQESIRFLGGEGKFERESWVVARLLNALEISFEQSQLLPPDDEPVDVAFCDGRFQVKELMEPNRRRGDELRAALTTLKEARSEADLSERYTPKEISFSDVVKKTLEKADELEAEAYGPTERQSLDLVCYFNYLDYSITPPLEMEKVRSSFRSISVVSNTYCAVIFVSGHAPAFLRSNLGQIVPVAWNEE